jgi:hypothetical protein
MNLKKISFLFLISFLCLTNLDAKDIEGTIITETETLKVTFHTPFQLFDLSTQNLMKMQYKVKYSDTNGKRNTLRPEDAKEIRFMFQGEEIRMISHYNSLGGMIITMSSHIFLHLKSEGNLSLYNFYYSESSGTGNQTYYSVAESSVLKKEGGELTKVRWFLFRKEMATYFEDCPDLVGKIKDKTFRIRYIVAIVEFYNASCAE